ncbi:MAG: hypothetical protein KJZ54_03670 [Phycisphaerales bacterium]|nr:hypothetical protein [Phycisphaerales bacterium]
MNRRTRTAVVALALGAGATHAGDVTLSGSVVAGGGVSAGGGLTLHGAAGQHEAGTLGAGPLALGGGFLPVLAGPEDDPCPADFNGDTVVNTLDFLAFLNAYTGGDPRADFNGDTVVNTLDVLAFLNAFVAGC